MAGRGLRLGALVLQSTAWSELAVKFRDQEEAGYDVAYVADHLTHPTLRCAEAAVSAGFDELVVYWPQGAPGSRFWSDPDVHRDGVRRVREAFDGPR